MKQRKCNRYTSNAAKDLSAISFAHRKTTSVLSLSSSSFKCFQTHFFFPALFSSSFSSSSSTKYSCEEEEEPPRDFDDDFKKTIIIIRSSTIRTLSSSSFLPPPKPPLVGVAVACGGFIFLSFSHHHPSSSWCIFCLLPFLLCFRKSCSSSENFFLKNCFILLPFASNKKSTKLLKN